MSTLAEFLSIFAYRLSIREQPETQAYSQRVDSQLRPFTDSLKRNILPEAIELAKQALAGSRKGLLPQISIPVLTSNVMVEVIEKPYRDKYLEAYIELMMQNL